MDGTFDERLLGEMHRRDKSAKALKRMFFDVGENVKTEAMRLTDGESVKALIAEHPFVAAGVALGAGVVVARLLTRRSIIPSGAAAEPQRVIIEIQHGTATSAAASGPKPFSPVDFIMQAVGAYETVQNLIRPYLNPKNPPPENPGPEAAAKEDEIDIPASAPTL